MKHIIKSIAGVIVTCFLIGYVTNELGYWLRPVNTDICINTIDTFHGMPENSFEVIGFGSSHMWRGLSAIELYDKYGIGAYNYGCNWQRINTTLLFVQDALKTQKPKVILIETCLVNELKNDVDVDGEIYYTTAINNDRDKMSYLMQCFGHNPERYVSYYIPLCAFHENWINISEDSFENDSAYTYDFFRTMGSVDSDDITPIKIGNPNEGMQQELSILSIQTLDNIVEICRENDIDIIFYTAPWKSNYKYSDAMQEYASSRGYQYFNLFEYVDVVGIDENVDFSDEGHLNTSGAKKVADFFGDYLIAHYNLTDFRGFENNIWEQYR